MENILGQQSAIEVLQKAFQSSRMHHAWIFHGPMGVGKFTTAIAAAKILLCHNRKAGSITACQTCNSCTLLNSPEGAHPDLHIVKKELALFSDDSQTRRRKLLNIPVDVIRKHLLEPAHRSSQLNHGKVLILDESELLQNEGQNALLKTLEEPPQATYIFLITSNENLLLPTIRSRCQRIGFAAIDEQGVNHWINQYLQSIDHDTTDEEYTPPDPNWVTWYASGSLGKAKLAIDYNMTQWGTTLTPHIERIAQGQPANNLGTQLQEAIDQFAKAWVASHDNASKDAANKAGLRYMFDLIGAICRRKIAQLTQQMTDANPVDIEEAITPWLTGIDLLQKSDQYIASNVAMALILDNLVIQWSSAISMQTTK